VVVLTNQGRVLEALRLSSLPLDDVELSQRAGVRPRQAVDQICRALERSGVLRRYQGPGGKIVNQLLPQAPVDSAPPASGTTAAHGLSASEPVLSAVGSHAVPPGSSREQREAERVMLDLLGTELGLVLDPTVGF
jgi:hypothetical protein